MESDNDSKSAYRRAALNATFYADGDSALSLSQYFRSTVHFFTPEYVKDGCTFLDVGGAGGQFSEAVRREVAKINPTVVDPDIKCIERGRRQFPAFKFINGYFPEAMPRDDKFDIVSMQALFPQVPNWKETLFALKKFARKYVNISLIFRLHGTTVIDKDVSYFYYLDSGERVHQIIHNIYEFINFLCIREMGVKKIEFFGYRTPSGHNFRCVPSAEQIKGNLMLELFENERDNPIRMGGGRQRCRAF